MRAKAGGETPLDSAAAQASGPRNATPAQASERSHPPAPKLSIGTLAIVQPSNVPDTAAIAATPIQRAGRHRSFADAVMPATTNMASANSTPPAAGHRHIGWFDTGAPQANFG